jgi:hypothetical protein
MFTFTTWTDYALAWLAVSFLLGLLLGRVFERGNTEERRANRERRGALRENNVSD